LPQIRLLTALLYFLLSGLGCSSTPAEPKTYPVVGKLTIDGKPLANAKVIFLPDAEKANTSTKEPRGTTDATGTFTITTDDQPGCTPGTYKATVFAMIDRSGEFKSPIWLAPLRYTDAKTSGLSVSVVETPTPGQYDLNLKP